MAQMPLRSPCGDLEKEFDWERPAIADSL